MQNVVQQTHVRHILLKITPTQTEDEARKKLDRHQGKRSTAKQIDLRGHARAPVFGRTARRPRAATSAGSYAGRHALPEFETVDERAEAGRCVGRRQDAVRPAPDPGHRAQERRHLEGQGTRRPPARPWSSASATRRCRTGAARSATAPTSNSARTTVRRCPPRHASRRSRSRSGSRPASVRRSRSAPPGRCATTRAACWSATPPSWR